MGNVWDMSDSLYTTKIDLSNFHWAAGGGGCWGSLGVLWAVFVL